jgi:hypothetical protein
VVRPGDYEVEVTYGCDPADAGGRYRLTAGSARLEAVTEPGGRSGVYVRRTAGTLRLEKGPATLTMEAVSIPGKVLMELHKLRLRRVADGTAGTLAVLYEGPGVEATSLPYSHTPILPMCVNFTLAQDQIGIVSERARPGARAGAGCRATRGCAPPPATTPSPPGRGRSSAAGCPPAPDTLATARAGAGGP